MGGSGEEVGLGEGRGRGGEKVEQEVALHYIFQLLKFLLGPLRWLGLREILFEQKKAIYI